MEDKKIDIRCPCCKALLMKIIKCLAGEKYIEIKCKKCKEVALVP